MRTALLLLLLLPLGAAVVPAQDEAAALFRSHCANCHNSNGNGKTPAGEKMKIPDLRAPQVQDMSDEQLFQTIANGTHHKQYPHTFLRKGMREAQIRGLVAHLRSLKANR